MEIGRFNKRRANEMFSQGLLTALMTGAVYIVFLLLLGSSIISHISPDEEILSTVYRFYVDDEYGSEVLYDNDRL